MSTASTTRIVRRALREPFTGRTWRECVYALSTLPLGVLWFSVAFTLLVTSATLLITLIGVPLLAASLQVIRLGAVTERYRARVLLGVTVAAPPSRVRDPRTSWVRSLLAAIADPPRWREAAYLVLLLALGVALFVGVVVAWAASVAAAISPVIAAAGGSVPAHGVWQSAALVAAGVLGVFATPWLIRALVQFHLLLLRGLLGPTAGELERAAARATAERDAALSNAERDRRQLERDLHDGAQARLVALAADLGRARQRLETGGQAGEATELVQAAHEEAKVVLREIRDLARGIHPAVLADRGLDAALSSLAASSPLAVQLSVQLDQRPPERIESAAYYVVSEALANAAKHGGGEHVAVLVAEQGGRLVIEVRDDGHGGADPLRGTGLRGLRDRVAALGGTLSVVSPPGGPTELCAELPCA